MDRQKIKKSFNGRVIAVSQIIASRLTRILLSTLWSYSIKSSVNFKNDEVYLFISNHQSRIDPFTIFAALSMQDNIASSPVRFMTASRIYFTPLLQPILKLMGCYPTRPKRIDPVTLTVNYMKSGYSTFIFPEGRRVLPHESTPKDGIVRIIQKNDAEITPVLVRITWSRKSYFKRHIDITISKPRGDLKKLNADEIMQKVYSI